MLEKTNTFLRSPADNKALQIAALVLDVFLFVLTFVLKLDFKTQLAFLAIYACQYLFFQKQWSILENSENVQYKKYQKFSTWVLWTGWAVLAVHTALSIYFKIELFNMPFGAAVCDVCALLIAQKMLGIVLYSR